MLHITDSQVAEQLDYRSVRAVLDHAFSDAASGKACIHPRQRSECEGVRLSTMGAIWSAEGVAGVKVYPTVAGRFSFAVLMFDTRGNEPIAWVDGNELTRFRTAAITALVVSKAARVRSGKLALFGAGLQGRSQAEALCELLALREVCVVDPVPDTKWCDQLAEQHDVRVRVVGAQEAVADADIVVTATRSAQPVFDGHWLSPGSFVCAIGTSTPKNRELDEMTMLRAQRVIVEWKPQSFAEAGEVALWEGRRDFDKFVDLPELYNQGTSWLGGENDITVFKSVGVGLADVAAAHLVISRIRSTHAAAGLTA